jgi:hypothetical protein
LFFRVVISKSPDNDIISYCFKGELEIVKHSEAEVDEHHATELPAHVRKVAVLCTATANKQGGFCSSDHKGRLEPSTHENFLQS